MVAVLLQIPQSATSRAAAHAKRRDRAVGQGDVFAECLCNPHSAEKWHAHGAQEAGASVEHSQQHDGGKSAAQELQQLRRDLHAASAG